MFGTARISIALAAICLVSIGLASADETQLPSTAVSGNGSTSDVSSKKGQLEDTKLEEIIVTAQKREEGMRNVPIPVSVLSGAKLTDGNQVKLTDFYDQVPGLSIAPSVESTMTLSVRGISTGPIPNGPPAAGPTVAIAIDGVPYGGSGGGDTAVPDFDPGVLARVEVLRGPQGTLYGSASLGGLINFVTTAPSTDRVSGRLEAGTNTVQNGAQQGYSVRGSVNLPVTGDFAVRASAFTRLDPGYIDNPLLGKDGVNEDRAFGAHVAALWKPSDSLSVNLSALFQKINGDGTNDVTPFPRARATFGNPPVFPATAGDLQQVHVAGVGPYHRESQAYSAIVTDRIGSVTLSSLTGYSTYSIRDEAGGTSRFVANLAFADFGVYGAQQNETIDIGRLSEELRLTTQLGQKVDLLVGGFVSHEVDHYQWDEFASDPFTGAIAGYFGTYDLGGTPTIYTDTGVFTDFTFHITDQFDVQVGGRESFYKVAGNPWIYNLQVATIFNGPPLCSATDPICVAFAPYEVKQNAPTYLFTPRYKLSPDLMVYARVATGFREGGSNAGAGTPDLVPQLYGPDKTTNYELGVKGDFLGHTLSVDASAYYIGWKDIQVTLFTPLGFGYTANGGTAKSQGLELTVQAKPTRGLTVGGWVDFSEAVLTADAPNALSGDKLPNSPRFSGNFWLNEEFPLWQSATGFVGGTLAYVGPREDAFRLAGRQYLPAYAKTDVRAGARFDDWTVNLYCNNVTNKRGIISGGLGNASPASFYLIQPRTVGLLIARKF